MIKAGLFHWAQLFVFSYYDYKSVLVSLTFNGLPHGNCGRLSNKNWHGPYLRTNKVHRAMNLAQEGGLLHVSL